MVIDFSGLMDDEAQKPKEIDFSGLMEAGPVKAEQEPSKSFVERSILAPEAVGELIAKRGTLWEQYTADTSGWGIGKTFLQNIALPTQMLESGLSNPIIEMQKGNINPIDWMVESAKGFGGVKQGQYGDVARMAGVPEFASATIGLGASFAVPIALLSAAKKMLAVTKFADTKLANAMTKFVTRVKGHGGALNKVGAKVGAYYDDIGNVAVDKGKYLDEMADMTNAMKKAVTEMPAGKIADIETEILNLAEKGDVYSVHQTKELIDDLINNFFTSKSQTQKVLRKASKSLGDIIDDAAYNSKVRTLGEKGASKYVDNFRQRRAEYSELKNGFNYVYKKIVNPETGKPTQTGALMRELADPRELNARATLNAIDKYGTGSRKFARELLDIESALKTREWWAGNIRYATHGVAIGATAGAVAGKIRSKEEQFLFGGSERE